MTQTEPPPPLVAAESRERLIVLLLCVVAAIHVFIFSAAFPLCNNVDELMHIDLVIKYAHGHVPTRLEPMSPEAARYIAIYGTFEYFQSRTNFPNGRFPPPVWTLPAAQADALIQSRTAGLETMLNHESSQPPLYYALAAAWWHFVKWCGLEIYGIRFLNVFLAAVLVWIGGKAARLVFPERVFLRLGVPALLAFMPQPVFYSICNDVLSPLCYGAAFIGLVKWWRADIPGARLGAFTGLALAATVLAKLTSVPLIGVSGLAVLVKAGQLARAKKLRASMPSLVLLGLCAALPVVPWLAWCKIHFGDFTGSAAKVRLLGWTLKPFAEWWHHPIFTPDGLWTYLVGQLGTFWQGEYCWDGGPLAWPAADTVYTLASLFLLAMATVGFLRRPAGLTPWQRGVLAFALVGFGAELAFFAFLSVIYDFHNCPDPSRAHPYFHAGRMLMGALVPFLLLFVYGLDRLLNRFGNAVKFSVLAGMILLMVACEILTDLPVFSSPYNWFHM